jgi:hypothetical protein
MLRKISLAAGLFAAAALFSFANAAPLAPNTTSLAAQGDLVVPANVPKKKVVKGAKVSKGMKGAKGVRHVKGAKGMRHVHRVPRGHRHVHGVRRGGGGGGAGAFGIGLEILGTILEMQEEDN